MTERPITTRRCTTPGCEAAARLYTRGWQCANHGPTPPPAPPAGTTAAELHAAATSTTYSEALAAERARRRRIRDEARAR